MRTVAALTGATLALLIGAAQPHAAGPRLVGEARTETAFRLYDLDAFPGLVAVGDHAVIARPGAPSRAAETASTADGLAPHFELHRIERGHVDGGDVLRIGKRLYVGRSTRTDGAGVVALAELVRPLGYEVIETELRDCLHLKTGATLAGPDASGAIVLLYCEQSVDPEQFAAVEPMAVDAGEPAAANCVRAGDQLILPAGNPKTADRLRDRGFVVLEVDASELQKAEAGVTCMSLIDER